MKEIFQYLPNDVEMNEEKGFVIRKGAKETLLTNAIPIVKERTKQVNHITNQTQDLITLQYLTHTNEWVGTEQDFSAEDIMSGKFIKKIPIEVQIEYSRIGQIFRSIIQKQIRTIPIETKEIYEFGWHEKDFHWLEDELQNISTSQEYEAALKVGSVILKDNLTIISLILAMAHGPMGNVLYSSGIQHDFVTLISGPTSIGKTAICKKICGYLKHRTYILALSSDRKEVKKTLQNSTDTTMIIDDFNISASDRVQKRQLQSVSEIIQEASDAGDVILDETSTKKRHNKIHIVVTSETPIRNISTMNRCFWVNMRKSIPSDLWNDISTMEEKNIFSIFIQSYVKYVEKNYDTIVANIKHDFEFYKSYVLKNVLFSKNSMNRIAETLAIQHSLKLQLVNYMTAIGIDNKLCKRLGESIDRCISSSGQELQTMIDDIYVKKSHMELLPTLAEIVSSLNENTGYKLAEDENGYRKKIHKGRLEYVGFQVNRGYISFSPRHMCRLIAKSMGKDNIAVNCLGKELSYYHLAHVDNSEQKQSCRWHTTEKYFHVHYRGLIELVCSMVYGDAPIIKELNERTILDFENAYQGYDF